jgi:hypothetical protein
VLVNTSKGEYKSTRCYIFRWNTCTPLWHCQIVGNKQCTPLWHCQIVGNKLEESDKLGLTRNIANHQLVSWPCCICRWGKADRSPGSVNPEEEVEWLQLASESTPRTIAHMPAISGCSNFMVVPFPLFRDNRFHIIWRAFHMLAYWTDKVGIFVVAPQNNKTEWHVKSLNWPWICISLSILLTLLAPTIRIKKMPTLVVFLNNTRLPYGPWFCNHHVNCTGGDGTSNAYSSQHI